jgi:hypothetical protein
MMAMEEEIREGRMISSEIIIPKQQIILVLIITHLQTTEIVALQVHEIQEAAGDR